MTVLRYQYSFTAGSDYPSPPPNSYYAAHYPPPRRHRQRAVLLLAVDLWLAFLKFTQALLVLILPIALDTIYRRLVVH